MFFWSGQRFYIWPENPGRHEAHLRGNEAKGAKPRDGPDIHVWITLRDSRRGKNPVFPSCFSLGEKRRNWLNWLTAACYGGVSRDGGRYLQLLNDNKAQLERKEDLHTDFNPKAPAKFTKLDFSFLFLSSNNKIDWFHSQYVSVY